MSRQLNMDGEIIPAISINLDQVDIIPFRRKSIETITHTFCFKEGGCQ